MIPLPRITFVIDQFAVPSPGQQLLDRFLIGYHSDGAFRAPGCEVLFAGPANQAIESRRREFGLRISPEVPRNSQAVIIAAEEPHVRVILNQLPAESRCFVYGLISPAAAELAQHRRIRVLSGTASGTAFRLPAISFPEEQARKVAVITTGPAAILDGLEALRSVSETRLSRLTLREKLDGNVVWDTAYSSDWQPLFSAAISRSNTIKGDPERDGRTQNIAGLRLVEKLVTRPRAWRLDHGDGLDTVVFDLTGALDDLNFAVRLNDGTVQSAQLYRPPGPVSDHFSQLAEKIEEFFRADSPETPRGLASLWNAAEKMNSD